MADTSRLPVLMTPEISIEVLLSARAKPTSVVVLAVRVMSPAFTKLDSPLRRVSKRLLEVSVISGAVRSIVPPVPPLPSAIISPLMVMLLSPIISTLCAVRLPLLVNSKLLKSKYKSPAKSTTRSQTMLVPE